MRSISYRTKLRLKAALKIFLLCLAGLFLLTLLALAYLQRYVVYTENGAVIDFNRSTARDVLSNETVPSTDASRPDVNIIIGEPGELTEEAAVLNGYYIDIAMLQDPDAALAAVKALTEPCTVMLDLKSSSGKFYYSTGIEGAVLADIDVTVVDEMLSYLRNHGFTVIARLQTYRDSAFALAHLDSSLAISGGALWSDNGYYWLDPSNETVSSYLKQIITELSSKGLREIVLNDFYFPTSAQIVYDSEKSKTALMQAAALDLLEYYRNSNLTLSFGNPATDFRAENPLSHILVDDANGSKINTILTDYAPLISSERQLVFLTNSLDTRFEAYSLLRPLIP